MVAPNNEVTLLAVLKENTSVGAANIITNFRRIRDEAVKTSQAVTDASRASNVASLEAEAAAIKSGKSAGTASKAAIDGVKGNARDLIGTLALMTKGLTIVNTVITFAPAAVNGLSAAYYALTGRMGDARQKFRLFTDDLEVGIRSLPLAGNVIADLGAKINNFATGIQDYQKQVKSDAERQQRHAEIVKLLTDRYVEQAKSLHELGRAYIQTSNQSKLEDLKKQLAELDDLLKKQPFTDAKGRLSDSGRQLQHDRAGLTQAIAITSEQIKEARLKYDDEITAAILRNRDKNFEAERLEFVRQLKEQELAAAAAGDGVATEQIAIANKNKLLGFDINQATAKADDARARRDSTIGNAGELAANGSISVFEEQQRINDAQAEYNTAIDESRQKLESLKAAQTDPAIVKNIQRQIDQLPQATNTLRSQINQVGFAVKDSLQQPMTGFFSSIITGSKSAKQAFADMIAGFAQNLANLAAQRATEAVFGAILGGGGGSGGGGVFGALFGGATKKAGGGFLPGAPSNVDTIPAMLAEGEHITNAFKAQRARGLLTAIDAGQIDDRILGGRVGLGSSVQHFNTGGPVTEAFRSSRASESTEPRIVPALILTAEEGRKIMDASTDALFEVLQRYPERIPSRG